jgi:LacI family transcriptional regulator
MRGITDTAKKSGFTVVLINTDENTAAEVDAVRVCWASGWTDGS